MRGSNAVLQLEDELAAARSQNHQLREDEAAAQRLLQQRQDDLQRTGRWMTLRGSCAATPHTPLHSHALRFHRRLVEAEDRLDAAAVAAASAEALQTRQAKALQALESDAAQARVGVGELEAALQQQALLLQARAQKEVQLEETVKQLEQVRRAAAAARSPVE